jgi:enterochelin esterase-like enzyme
MSQVEGVDDACGRFERLGANVKFTLYSGGHDFAAWRQELAPALTWLFS